jgi:hypothetical protein
MTWSTTTGRTSDPSIELPKPVTIEIGFVGRDLLDRDGKLIPAHVGHGAVGDHHVEPSGEELFHA